MKGYAGLALGSLVAIGYVLLGLNRVGAIVLSEPVIACSILSGFALWVWMVTDFFQTNDRLKSRVLWGWTLFLFSLFAGMLYFFVVYWPRQRQES